DDAHLWGCKPRAIAKVVKPLGFTRISAHESSGIREVSRGEFSVGRAAHAPPSQERLNRALLILSALIFDSSVEGGMPSRAAAPAGPDTRPFVAARAASIRSRSRVTSSAPSDCPAGGPGLAFRASQ